MATAADYERLGAWANILNPDQNIDRRQCRRQVPMEVLSLGAPRTGTLSMKEAYEILGIPSYHYASIFANCRDADMWQVALAAKSSTAPSSPSPDLQKEFFDQLLGHVGAVTDVPCIIFWRELMAAYPDAKVVLVSRDEAKWQASINVLVSGILNPVGRYVLRFTDPARFGRILNCGMSWIRVFFRIPPNQRLSVDGVVASAPHVYREHYAAIRATVPRDRLLEYELGSGWGPLCKFLGKDVPTVPFPHRNDAAMLDQGFGAFLKSALFASLINVSTIGAGIVAVVAVVAKMIR